MLGWDALVELLRESVFVLAHLFGGSLGSAIAALSVTVRLLLLPLTLRTALRVREHQLRLRTLAPTLERLRARYAHDPMQLAARTRALYRRHGLRPIPEGVFRAALVQLPLGAALYQAISGGLGAGHRFLWISDLAKPDALLATAVAALAAGATAATPSATGNSGPAAHLPVFLSGAVTLLVVWRVAAGVGVYWGASSLVGVVQGLLVRRLSARETPAVPTRLC